VLVIVNKFQVSLFGFINTSFINYFKQN